MEKMNNGYYVDPQGRLVWKCAGGIWHITGFTERNTYSLYKIKLVI